MSHFINAKKIRTTRSQPQNQVDFGSFSVDDGPILIGIPCDELSAGVQDALKLFVLLCLFGLALWLFPAGDESSAKTEAPAASYLVDTQ